MIPKIIHYCWFGRGEKPKLAKKCIASWRKYCPDYEIVEWNEDNFDIYMNGYTKMCYEQKYYAFLSDYVRLLVVAEYGGIYFDTDVELLKSPSMLLKNDGFFGFENSEYVNTGLGFGAIAHGEIVEAMLEEYEPLLDGTKGIIGCPILNTQALVKYGLEKNGKKQNVRNSIIYPEQAFNPYDSATGRLKKTTQTISIHWYAATWMSKKQRIRSMLSKPFHRIFGVEVFKRYGR